MTTAYQQQPDLPNLLLDPTLGGRVVARQAAWRGVVSAFVVLGIPAPVFGTTLTYFDSYRTGRLPANLTQAQRDFFGAHGFERIDAPGAHHGPWGSGN